MKTINSKLIVLLASLACMISTSLSADWTDNAVVRTFEKINEGDIIIDNRIRYERVNEDNKKSANAITNRVRFGYETPAWNNLKLLAEYEGTWGIPDDEDYNSTTNGVTDHATVADPDSSQLNRLQISYAGEYNTNVILGRQRVNIDNQRFVGAVGWRQNEQTHDALFISNSYLTPLDRPLTLSLGLVTQVNTFRGSQSALDELDTNTTLMHAAYQAMPWMKLTAYGYLVEIDDLPGLSSDTLGLALTGTYGLTEKLDVNYRAEYATQSDAGANTSNYTADYFHLAASADLMFLHAGVGLEFLGSDNGSSFQFPLGTNHKFNGWADAFLTTPADGLVDYYGWAGIDLGSKVKIKGIYHYFEADEGNKEFGHELDGVIDIKMSDNLGMKITWAQLFATAEGGKTDKTKGTVQIDFKY